MTPRRVGARVPVVCEYGCGGVWLPPPGHSDLVGHAACAGTAAWQDDVLELVERFPQAGKARIAADLGVTYRVLASWVAIAAARRRRHRRAMR